MKEKILISTLELASEKGLRAVSMSQIATKCGLSKSSLYSHYKSKEEIITKMYEYFREKALELNPTIDISSIDENSTFLDVLSIAVEAYKEMNSEHYLAMFYKIIYAERTLDKEAAKILILETNKMVDATKVLFKKTNELGLSHIDNVDVVSMSFALSINQIMNYEYDLYFMGSKDIVCLESYIKEFSRVYGVKKHEA